MCFSHQLCKPRPWANLHLSDRFHQLLRNTADTHVNEQRSTTDGIAVNSGLRVRFYRCSRITNTDFWCFCDNRRGKESKICWQHTEVQLRAMNTSCQLEKYYHTYSPTRIPSKPFFQFLRSQFQEFLCAADISKVSFQILWGKVVNMMQTIVQCKVPNTNTVLSSYATF